VRWIWRALTRRLLLKFIALLCAVVLWVAALDATSSARIFEVPLDVYTYWTDSPMRSTETTGVPKWPDGVPVAKRPLRVEVTVRGPAEIIDGLDAGDIKARLPIKSVFDSLRDAGLKAEVRPFALRARNAVVRGAAGAIVTRVEPGEVRLKVEPF